jgi:proliferating cell nuclear antigen PCNA
MKEGRIFEVTADHTQVLKNVFEILAGVLHELEMHFTKPEKPIDNEKPDTDSDNSDDDDDDDDKNKKVVNKSKINKSDNSNSDNSNSDNSDNSDSDSDSDSKSKSNSNKISKINKNNIKNVKENDIKTKGGIKIVEINDYESIIIVIKLDAENFYKFDCKPSSFSIGMDPTNMFNILKNIDKEGNVTFYVNEHNKQTLNIELQNNEKKSRSIYNFKLMEIDRKQFTPPPPEVDIIIQMKTKDFHDICKELSTYSQFMIIECSDKKIQFKCKGAVREFEHDEEGRDNCVSIKLNPKKDKSKPVIVREIYDLNDICMFNKCKNISTNVQILLRNDYIMFIKYKVASYGTMTVGFNPANEKLVNKHANYDGEKFDAFYKPTDVKYRE